MVVTNARLAIGLAASALLAAQPLRAFDLLGSSWADGNIVMHLQLGQPAAPLLDGAVDWFPLSRPARLEVPEDWERWTSTLVDRESLGNALALKIGRVSVLRRSLSIAEARAVLKGYELQGQRIDACKHPPVAPGDLLDCDLAADQAVLKSIRIGQKGLFAAVAAVHADCAPMFTSLPVLSDALQPPPWCSESRSSSWRTPSSTGSPHCSGYDARTLCETSTAQCERRH